MTTQYTEEDLAVFKEASAKLAQIVTLTKLVPSRVPQSLCAEMDEIFRHVYARRFNRIVNDYMQADEGEKLEPKKPLTLYAFSHGWAISDL